MSCLDYSPSPVAWRFVGLVFPGFLLSVVLWYYRFRILSSGKEFKAQGSHLKLANPNIIQFGFGFNRPIFLWMSTLLLLLYPLWYL